MNHPYCNSGSDASLDRQTKICRPALWLEPIYISGETCRPSPCPDTQPNLPLITGASLAAALILAVSLVLLHRLACRRPQTHLDKTAADRSINTILCLMMVVGKDCSLSSVENSSCCELSSCLMLKMLLNDFSGGIAVN